MYLGFIGDRLVGKVALDFIDGECMVACRRFEMESE